MKQNSERARRVTLWACATVAIICVAVAAYEWANARFARRWVVPQAIYSAAQLTDAYHAYWRAHEEWPAPGSIVAKEVGYVRTFRHGKMRCDVFNFGGGQYVDLELHDNGRLIALPIPEELETADARKAAGTAKEQTTQPS